jgi:GxxExxY protein
MPVLDVNSYPLQEETDKIIGLAIEVHKILGPGFLEIVYKDALEYEFNENNYQFSREEEYKINYKKTILKHKFYADFVVFEKVIVEVLQKMIYHKQLII